MSLLDLKNLNIDIPTPSGLLHAVRGLSLSVEKGETLCIVGESGCGKSLTSHALIGLTPRKAQVRFDGLTFRGQDLLRLNEKEWQRLRGNRISMVFQDPMTCLNPCFTIGSLLEEVFVRHFPRKRSAARKQALSMLEKVGIADPHERLGQYPHQLSGGLRQRVMIAMALMCGPELLIADEPTTALDVTIQLQILRLLADLQRDMGLAIIFVTHDLGLVSRFGDRVAVMYAGRIVEHGSVTEVFRAPRHPYTRALMGCIPAPGASGRNKPLGSIPGMVPSLIGDFQGCSFFARCTDAGDRCRVRTEILPGASETHWYECVQVQGGTAHQ